MHRTAPLSILITITILMSTAAVAQDEESAPATEAGESLDLSAVLQAFSEAENVEDFEKRLNDPDQGIVNLDLNEDDEVDYVGVFEEVDGNVRVMILRVPLSEDQNQDVASVELEKTGEDVTAQVVGDPEIYGEGYIIEPDISEAALFEVPKAEPLELASSDGQFVWPEQELPPAWESAAVVVRSWGVVRVVFAPGYKPWRSPYRWKRYPSRYRARRPVARSSYRSRHYRHKSYRRTTHRRSHRAGNVYSSNRSSSNLAKQKQRKVSPATSTVNSKSGSPGTSKGSSTTQKTTQHKNQSTNASSSSSHRKSPSRDGPSHSRGGGLQPVRR
jgi:hypothetical protein